MQVSGFLSLRLPLATVAILLVAGCSGIPSGDTEANLVAESVVIDPSTPATGQQFTVTATFSNQKAATGNPFGIRLRLLNSLGGQVGPNLVDERFNGSLDTGAVSSVSWIISETLPEGTGYQAVVFVDVNNEVTESTIGDNEQSATFVIVAADDKPSASKPLPSGDG